MSHSNSKPDPGFPGDFDLVERARDVLLANQVGNITCPSPKLYPHQWSWDTAFLAMGYATFDQERAQKELTELFGGQWANGLLPAVVFTADAGHYFPDAEFWQSWRSVKAPDSPATSGTIQPPVHATAVLTVVRRAADVKSAQAFGAGMFPKLVQWHGYLYGERTRGDDLVEVWHPWESGMDNSARWDQPLSQLEFEQEEVPLYRRADLDVSRAGERPTEVDYDRYVYLANLLRSHGYDDEAARASHPFAVQDVVFNAILIQAERDLADLAEVIGESGDRFRARADATADALAKLFDEEHACYFDFDVRAAKRLVEPTVAGLLPLYAGVAEAQKAMAIVGDMSTAAVRPVDAGWLLPSLESSDHRFSRERYWRGPIWPVINWLALRGLEKYGYRQEAAAIKTAMLELVRREGFFEYFDPVNGQGRGASQFAWTAAFVLDFLYDGYTPTE